MLRSMHQKYNNDPVYRQLVDYLEALIHQAKYTPSEMREAAVMASINYEMHRYNKIVYLEKETEEAFHILRNRVDKEES